MLMQDNTEDPLQNFGVLNNFGFSAANSRFSRAVSCQKLSFAGISPNMPRSGFFRLKGQGDKLGRSYNFCSTIFIRSFKHMQGGNEFLARLAYFWG